MQPTTREMQVTLNNIGAAAAHLSLQDVHNSSAAGHDEFFDQMLSGIPGAWPDLGNPKSPWDSTGSGAVAGGPYDDSSLLAARLRQHHIAGGGSSSPTGRLPMLQLNHRQSQQQMLLSAMAARRSPTAAGAGDCAGLLPLPLTLGSGAADSPLKSPTGTGYNGYGQSIPNQQQFNHARGGGMGMQNYGGVTAGCGAGQTPATSVSTASGSAGSGAAAAAAPRQRVRARRGQATDPHSIAERLRRERIAERMKALQELVPNGNKTDKASMLDEIIDYVKFLQLQVKVLSMSRLGGAGAVAPLVSDISTEGRGGANGAAGNDSSLTVTEHQVAKLMEEDMGSAMQYLQGKGLCLMPISLASAISTATCRPSPSLNPGILPAHNSNAVVAGDTAPASPNMSVLTAQSTMVNGTAGDTDVSRSSGGKDSSVGANQ